VEVAQGPILPQVQQGVRLLPDRSPGIHTARLKIWPLLDRLSASHFPSSVYSIATMVQSVNRRLLFLRQNDWKTLLGLRMSTNALDNDLGGPGRYEDTVVVQELHIQTSQTEGLNMISAQQAEHGLIRPFMRGEEGE
jgi:hypothetical protein